MKKIILLAIVVLASSAQMFAGPIVTIQLSLGKKSQDCSRFAICDWGVEVSFKSAVNTNASVQIDENQNALLLNLTPEAAAGKEEFLRYATVTFEEGTTVPLKIQQALGWRNTINIAAGNYKLMKTSNGYQITIPLQ